MSISSLSPLGPEDLDALCSLVARCVAHDGGLPMAANRDMVDEMYLRGDGVAVRTDAGIVAAAAVVDAGDGWVNATGVVDPSWRGRSVGTTLMAWIRATADGRTVRFKSEAITDGLVELLEKHGLTLTFLEHVMTRPTSPPISASPTVALSFQRWSDGDSHAFFATYRESFRERPGFPGWSHDQWVHNESTGEGFDDELSVLALDAAQEPAGFVMVEGHWIIQIGVVPSSRRRGVATALLAHVTTGLHQRGVREVGLNVNDNNPTALSLYELTGFERVGRRGRFEPRRR